jgi:hypothetical protein
MDKLVAELIELLGELQAAYSRLVAIAENRRDAMRSLDAQLLTRLLEREAREIVRCQQLELSRKDLVERFKRELGRHIQPSTTEIARRCPEPLKTQILVRAGQLRQTMEQLDRSNRINHRASQAIIGAIARMMKAVTGLAQHAGLYMRNGRKASIRGVNLLDIAG